MPRGRTQKPEDEVAEVVQFSERARMRSQRRSREEPEPDADDAGLAQPMSLAREATFRRLAELAREKDPVPEGVISAAKALRGWKSIDDELARLVYDSRTDVHLLTSVRSGGFASRQLTFESPDLVLEVEVVAGESKAMTCQVVPPQAAELEVRHKEGTVDLGHDDHGTFHLPSLPEGPVSLRCQPTSPGACSAATSWITL